MTEIRQPEPWLRGTLAEIPAVHRAVLHALELAGEDLERWCKPLSDEQLRWQSAEIPPVAFHLRHIARSLDRLLSYADGRTLSAKQLSDLQSEMEPGSTGSELFSELFEALKASAARVRILMHADLEAPRRVGKEKLPTTLGGLLVHVAEHTQRHVGQAITTAKLVRAQTP
jgi:uncharacterized damage-inducible protein DinB